MNREEDARVLPPIRDRQGRRHREWRDVTADSYDCYYEDHPVTRRGNGILSGVELCENLLVTGGDPLLWLTNFASLKRIQLEDAAFIQLESWCRVLHYAGVYDQLNIGGNACLEEVCRQIQSYVDAYSDTANVSFKDARHYTARMTAADVIVPSLKEDVARRITSERALNPGVRRGLNRQDQWPKQHGGKQQGVAAPGDAGGGDHKVKGRDAGKKGDPKGGKGGKKKGKGGQGGVANPPPPVV